MAEQPENQKKENPNAQRDYEHYKMVVDLWARENPIKTAKLQVLLAVNAILVSALNFSRGLQPENWHIYVAGTIFNLVWTFSIGRTCLFQDVWQVKAGELRKQNPNDPRFSVLETSAEQRKVRPVMRRFGGIPSRYYLLYTPFAFTLIWLLILVTVSGSYLL
ncbi:MAG TPA: hypothetical protein VGL11_13725, partial [Candidatus Binatia bacterium]